MFKATVVASKLRENLAQYFELASGKDVVQILHRGNDVKVLMSQEHYLNLLSMSALSGPSDISDPEREFSTKTARDIERNILTKLRQLEDEEPKKNTRKMGKVRSRQT